MTPPEEFGALKWLLDHAWAVVIGLVGVVWKQQGATIKSQGDAAAEALASHGREDERQFKALHDEQQLQRGHIAKIFDKLEANSLRAEDRHNELMKTIHQGLSSKADK